MTYLSVTRFRLRSGNPLGLALFFWRVQRSSRQAVRAPGFLGGKLAAAANRTYWTVTLWQDEASMKAYRNSGNHRAALRGMRLLGRYCSEAAVFGRGHEGRTPPELDLLLAELNAAGRFWLLPHPSAAHLERRLEPARSLGMRLLEPLERSGGSRRQAA